MDFRQVCVLKGLGGWPCSLTNGNSSAKGPLYDFDHHAMVTLFGGGGGGVLMICRILSGFHRLEQLQLVSVHLHGGKKKTNFYA